MKLERVLSSLERNSCLNKCATPTWPVHAGAVGLISGRGWRRGVAGELLITESASQSVVFTEEPERQLGV